MDLFKCAVIGLAVTLGGCAVAPKPTLTPLQIQSIQTREFESSKNIVFPSVLSVFQDLGYIIKTADKDTGLITAESTAKSDQASKLWLGISKISQVSGTAFIETIGKTTKVRLNFVLSNKTSNAYGQTDRQDEAIVKLDVYNNAFERIESAIFVRSAN